MAVNPPILFPANTAGFFNNLFQKIHCLVSPNLGGVILYGFTGQTESELAKSKYMIIPCEFRNIVPPMVRRRAEPMDQYQCRFAFITQFNIVDFMILPEMCLISRFDPRKFVVVHIVKIGQRVAIVRHRRQRRRQRRRRRSSSSWCNRR